MELKFREGRVVNFLLSEVPVAGRTGFEAGSRRSREEVSEDAYTDMLLELKCGGRTENASRCLTVRCDNCNSQDGKRAVCYANSVSTVSV